MQRVYSQIIGLPVVKAHDGQIIGLVYDTIINRETGKIEGFWVREGGLFGGKKILRVNEIREWKLKVYIDDENALADPSDFIRLKEVIENDHSVFLKRVVTLNGIYIGRVYDFNFDTLSYKLGNLYIVKKFFFFTIHRRIVPSKEIVEIREDEIVIKSDLKLLSWRKKNLMNFGSFVFTPEPEPKVSMNDYSE